MSDSSETSIGIYLHWSKKDLISQSDRHTIKLLQKEVDYLIVVCNLNSSPKQNIIFDENIIYLMRKNIGYDFGGYQAGIKYAMQFFKNISELIICNNSIFTVTDSLAPTLQLCRNSSYDVTGLTDSYEVDWHIQSYFLHFKRKVIQSPTFIKWWDQLPISNKKSEIVKFLEIPQGRYFINAGFNVGAIWSLKLLKTFALSGVGIAMLSSRIANQGFQRFFKDQKSSVPLNPTHMLWIHLLELGFPFIKKDLLARRVPLDLSQSEWRLYVKNGMLSKMIASEI